MRPTMTIFSAPKVEITRRLHENGCWQLTIKLQGKSDTWDNQNGIEIDLYDGSNEIEVTYNDLTKSEAVQEPSGGSDPVVAGPSAEGDAAPNTPPDNRPTVVQAAGDFDDGVQF